MYSTTTTTSTGMALGPGPQRGTPDRPGGEPQTPAQILNGWLSRLERTPFGGVGNVESVLTAISQGDGLLGMRPAVAAAFSTLIEYEEYGVFVEVFNAWCACCQTDGEPFKASLDLCLPHDWNPAYRAEMVEAFGRIQVHQVRVKSDSDSTPFHPIPEAVCMCVAAMVKGSTRELHVFGELAAPDVVADALRLSKLQSITLGESARQHEELGAREIASYVTLAESLRGCKTLEHLEIRHGDLRALSAYAGDTVTVKMPNPVANPVDLDSTHRGFSDEMLAKSPTLATSTSTTTHTTTTTTSTGATALQELASDPIPSQRIDFSLYGRGRDKSISLLLLPRTGGFIYCSGKEKMQDVFDFLRWKHEIPDEMKIALSVNGKPLYADAGKFYRHVNSVATANDLYSQCQLVQGTKVFVAITPFASQRGTAPEVGSPLALPLPELREATTSKAISVGASSAIDYKMPGPNRKIAYQFVIDQKPVRLYFEGKESGEDMLAVIRRELNVLPHATAYLQSGDLKIYLNRDAFNRKKNYYEENGFTDLAGNMRIAADVNALVRITKGREASVQVGLEEA